MWSQLINTPVSVAAKYQYDSNNCQYHNWQHILDCYSYLELNSVPYSQDLDYAVMHHDIVYDSLPEKEARSAEFVVKKYPNITAGAVEPIMATTNHSIRDTSEIARWMIRADLHQLADIKLAAANYVKIMNESIELYNVDTATFARNNLNFMRGLNTTIVKNYAIDNDQFWLDVLKGINLTMQFSSAVLTAGTDI